MSQIGFFFFCLFLQPCSDSFLDLIFKFTRKPKLNTLNRLHISFLLHLSQQAYGPYLLVKLLVNRSQLSNYICTSENWGMLWKNKLSNETKLIFQYLLAETFVRHNLCTIIDTEKKKKPKTNSVLCTDRIFVCSAVGSFFLSHSHVVLPKKRQRPHIITSKQLTAKNGFKIEQLNQTETKWQSCAFVKWIMDLSIFILFT